MATLPVSYVRLLSITDVHYLQSPKLAALSARENSWGDAAERLLTVARSFKTGIMRSG